MYMRVIEQSQVMESTLKHFIDSFTIKPIPVQKEEN